VFKVREIIEATSGKLIQGNYAAAFEGISTDSRSINPKDAFLALKGKNFDGHDFIAQAVKSKTKCVILEKVTVFIPPSIPVVKVKDTTKALGDIARFNRKKFDIPLIAVTGSNGKTTTKEMIAWVLSANSKVLKNEGTKNNQIGLPQTLIKLNKKFKYAVVEIGTNHFGEVDYLSKIACPDIGVITNIGPSHLEFLKDLKGVLKEKTALLKNIKSPAIGVLCADDKLLKPFIKRRQARPVVLSYGINQKSDFFASDIRLENGRLKFKVNGKRRIDFALSTLGYYNIYNALAAISVGRIFGLSYQEIAERLSTFKFPQGRLNLIESQGTKFIDDSYNSNPLSLKAALMALKSIKNSGRKIFIMGDMLELGKKKEYLHRQAGALIGDACDLFITVGKLSRLSGQEALKKGFKKQNLFFCGTAAQARDLLFKKVVPGREDIILIKGSRSMKMEEVLGV